MATVPTGAPRCPSTAPGSRRSDAQAGALEVRVFNPTDDADDRVTLPGCAGWLVDLRGRPVAPFEGSFPLRPHGIATARLDGR